MKKEKPKIFGIDIYDLLTLETIRHRQTRKLEQSELDKIAELADKDPSMYDLVVDYVETWM